MGLYTAYAYSSNWLAEKQYSKYASINLRRETLVVTTSTDKGVSERGKSDEYEGRGFCPAHKRSSFISVDEPADRGGHGCSGGKVAIGRRGKFEIGGWWGSGRAFGE